MKNIRIFLILMGVLSVSACQYVAKPQPEVRLKPVSWQAAEVGFSHADQSTLVDWLTQFPQRDLFLQLNGRAEYTKQLKTFLLQRGFRSWQLDGSNVLQPAQHSGFLQLRGVLIQRLPAACPDWRLANMADSRVVRSSNFGCASQHNLLVSVSDSRDFVRGKALSQASAEKMVRALQQYYGRPEQQQTDSTQSSAPASAAAGSTSQNN